MGIFVQFDDEKEERILSIFDCPQDPAVWPNQGTVEADDPRYLSHPVIRLQMMNDSFDLARVWRDAEIVRVSWLRDRHRDEVEVGAEPTLTTAQYTELLAYIKALRDWPATAEFPAEASRPLVPVWITGQLQ